MSYFLFNLALFVIWGALAFKVAQRLHIARLAKAATKAKAVTKRSAPAPAPAPTPAPGDYAHLNSPACFRKKKIDWEPLNSQWKVWKVR